MGINDRESRRPVMLALVGVVAIALILFGAFSSVSSGFIGGTTTINSTTVNNTTVQSTTIQSTTIQSTTIISDTTQITSQTTIVSTQITANSCTTAKYAVSINGTGFLGCKNVQWGNITAYPTGSGGCATGTNFVYKINSTNYYCSNVSFSSLTNFPAACSANQYVSGFSATVLTCSQVGWTQLTGYPSGCASNQFVTAVGSTLTCSNVTWNQLTSFPTGSGSCAINSKFVYIINATNYYCSSVSFANLSSLPTGCSAGQYASALTSTALTCSAVGWTQLTGFPSACSGGQFVTTIGSTITCSAVAWNQITSFPSGSGSCASGSNYVYQINSTNYYCSAPVKNSTFWFVNSGNLVVNGHFYGLSGATSATEIPVSVFCPYAGYFKNLAFQLTASPGTGAAVIVTLDRNTIGQSLVATCTNPATTCVDNTHTVYCAGGANNYVDFALTETGVVTAGLSIGISVNYVGNGV